MKARDAVVVFLFKGYAKIRPYTSSILWRLFYKRHFKNAAEPLFPGDPYQEPMFAFETLLGDMDYQWDIGKGLIDTTIPVKYASWFFRDVKKGRDCDDYIRVWGEWGRRNGYVAREWFSIDPAHPFKTAHVIGTLEKRGEVRLCSLWHISCPLASVDQAHEVYRGWAEKGNSVIIEYDWKKEW